MWRRRRRRRADPMACIEFVEVVTNYLEGAMTPAEAARVDFLSVEQKGTEGHPVHKALLGNGVVIVEGLDLGGVAAGVYTVMCLPLKIIDGDGGPARALLSAE